ncbi:hypothetical protein LZ518_12985 [Sphingomonas sp. RB56-2]|uniref:EF-hand domain-containing protein n=1 Tax=Sphingomonas brevis TaxID=2908206 RepID=A0ABT0SCA9_9SPHN|nr:hypothetical protein [Sphingomonas brevis]MCL6742044.1 hypothetical protein [Sphingomonas brevis]
MSDTFSSAQRALFVKKGLAMHPGLLVATAMLLGSVANAQPAAPQGHAAKGRSQIYLTLMGEPFRGQPGAPPPLDDWMARADTNHDGSISLIEFVADAGRFLDLLDVNKNGRIDADEIQRYEQVVAPPAVRLAGGLRPPGYRSTGASHDTYSGVDMGDAQEGDPDAGIQMPGGTGFGRGPAMIAGLPQPVAMADIDLNRIVTKEEFQRVAVRRFQAADFNGDHALSRDELSGNSRKHR